jgi:acyl phosphate:glycerol-3-phosphate acyltransferase
MTGFFVLLVAYLLGAIPFGYLLVKWKTGADVRTEGSGNIGATNVLRTTGKAAGVVTLLLDIAKGYLAVWLAGRITGGSALWMSAAAVAVMVGHAFPVFLRFRGGKAVASVVGAFLCLAPLALGLTAVVFVAAVAATRYISVGSMVGAVALAVLVWLLQGTGWPAVAAALAGVFIIWRHKGNLARLRAGTENRFHWGGKS